MSYSAKDFNRIRAITKAKRVGKPVVMRYYAEKLSNDNFIKRFVVLNGHLDPTIRVVSECADGTSQDWLRIEEDGRSVFVAQDGYLGGPIAFIHDKDLNTEAMVFEQNKLISFPE